VESTLQIYLKEINESALLTADEEKMLARKILNDNDPVARDRMIRSNLRLVVNIAKKFTNRGMPLSDLIEEGNLGLLRAVESFDPEQGNRFSTYGSWWIKQAIKRSLINAVQPIHIPAYMIEMISRWKKTTAELRAELGRTPSIEEMSIAMHLNPKKAQYINKAVKAYSSPTQMPSSEDSLTLNEMIEDEHTMRPDEKVFNNDELNTIKILLEQMGDREAQVLKLRYGLTGQDPLTLKEIGKHVGLTRERVRQIEKESLAKLRDILSDQD